MLSPYTIDQYSAIKEVEDCFANITRIRSMSQTEQRDAIAQIDAVLFKYTKDGDCCAN